MKNADKILKLINKKEAKWMRVNKQPCMYTFIDDFYINLCMYKQNNKNVISLDVDDVKKGISDILAEDFTEGDTLFNEFYKIYSTSKDKAENIALQE